MKHARLTQFQLRRIAKIETASGFEHFCIDPRLAEGRPGPIVITWYANNKLHAERVGQSRTLRVIE